MRLFKKLTIILFFGIIPIVSSYAEDYGITINEANRYAKEYLQQNLQSVIDSEKSKHISKILCTLDITNTDRASQQYSYYVEAEFNNVLINRQRMSGNLNFHLVLNEKKNILQMRDIEINQDKSSKITLNYSACLTDTMKESIINDEIDRAFENPLTKNHIISREENLESGIRIYSTVVADNKVSYVRSDIMYQNKEESIGNNIVLISTKWESKNFTIYSELPFPDDDLIIMNLEPMMLELLIPEFQKFEGDKNGRELFSKIIRIDDINAIDANEKNVRFKIQLSYKYSRFIGLTKTINVIVEADFNMVESEKGDFWELENENTVKLIDWNIIN